MLTNAHDNNDSYHYQILAMLWSPYWDPTDIILLNAHNILKVSLIPFLMQQMKLKKTKTKNRTAQVHMIRKFKRRDAIPEPLLLPESWTHLDLGT